MFQDCVLALCYQRYHMILLNNGIPAILGGGTETNVYLPVYMYGSQASHEADQLSGGVISTYCIP